MAKVTQKSGLAGKLGTAGAKAVAEHKDDPISLGGGSDLPDGINGGIAQLVDCEFSQYDSGDLEGEYYFRAAGIVVSPEVHAGFKIAGLRTQIMEPMCETPTRGRKTVEEHVAWVLNEMRKLGADTTSVTVDDLESVAAALKGEGPFFRFRTWKGQKQTTGPYAGQEPRVQEQWKGICEFDGDAAPAVDDSTAEAEEEPEQEVAEEPAEAASDEMPSAKEITALGKAADGGDESAGEQLEELAAKFDIDVSEIKTWKESAALIVKAMAEAPAEEETEAEESEEVVPAKGEIWYYKKKGAKKYAECEVTAIYATSKKANLKNLDTKEVLKSIPWDELKAENPSA